MNTSTAMFNMVNKLRFFGSHPKILKVKRGTKRKKFKKNWSGKKTLQVFNAFYKTWIEMDAC